MKRICSWRGKEMEGILEKDSDLITPGICEDCQEKLRKE